MKRPIVLIAALVAGLLAALLTRMFLQAKADEARRIKARFVREYGEMEALCFVRDVASGTVVTAQDLGVCKTYRKGNENTVLTARHQSDVVGRRTVGFHEKGVPLRWNDFEGGDMTRGGLSGDVSPHWRAMSITVTGAAAVSGMVQPGDRVDVIGTFNFPDDEGKIRRGDPVTCTILQNVLVYATGSETAKMRARSLAEGGGSLRGGYSQVTLQVTPREAEMLAFAEQIKGRLVLTLRSRTDTETEDVLPTVDFTRIRSEIEELNKLRNPVGRRKPAGAR